MKQEYQVHLVPTDKVTKNSIALFEQKLYLGMAPNYIPQHLYITSNEEIKENNWCVYGDMIGQYLNGVLETSSTVVHLKRKSLASKIVATTNPELWHYKDHKWQGWNTYPKIPQSFIETYIKAYNEENPIKEVKLETEKDGYWMNLHEQRVNGPKPEFIHTCDKLKLTDKGEVIIIPNEEKLYTREEVIKIADKCFQRFAGKTSKKATIEWFDKNYPQ